MSDANKATSLGGAVRSSVALASASVLAMATAGELGGVDVRRRERSDRPVQQLGDCFQIVFLIFPLFSFCFPLPNSSLLVDLSKLEKMLEVGLSHDVSWGVSAGISFLPGTVGVCGSSRSVRAKGSALGAEITMTRHKA